MMDSRVGQGSSQFGSCLDALFLLTSKLPIDALRIAEARSNLNPRTLESVDGRKYGTRSFDLRCGICIGPVYTDEQNPVNSGLTLYLLESDESEAEEGKPRLDRISRAEGKMPGFSICSLLLE